MCAMKYIVLLFIILLQLVCCQYIITTIAGTGTATFSGDNGAATSATLYNPIGVTLDASGRILYYCPLHRYTVSSAMFDEIFFYFFLIFPCPIQATCTSVILIIIVSAR